MRSSAMGARKARAGGARTGGGWGGDSGTWTEGGEGAKGGRLVCIREWGGGGSRKENKKNPQRSGPGGGVRAPPPPLGRREPAEPLCPLHYPGPLPRTSPR